MVWIPARWAKNRSSHDFPPPEIDLHEKAGIDQSRQIELQLPTPDDLTDDHR